MKLCLGTVQFGMNYGVMKGGQPSLTDALKMLDYATQKGVDAIDTAAAYGTAESVVGEFLTQKTIPRENLYIVTKFGLDVFKGAETRDYTMRLNSAVYESLSRLRTDYLDAFICHVPSVVNDKAILEELIQVKESGRVKHIGVSFYETSDVDVGIDTGLIDFMQVPLSVFDQRMITAGCLAKAKCARVDVHTRSAFLQGLLLAGKEAVPPHLKDLVPYLLRFSELCKRYGVTARAASMAFVRSQQEVSHLVFGVDSMSQLRENISAFSEQVPNELLKELKSRFSSIPSELVMPNKWKK